MKGSEVSKQVYEVWNFMGSGEAAFVSDDPVEIVYWLRARKSEDEYSGHNVHPVGEGFHRHKMIEHNFIARHARDTAKDMIRKAFESGEIEDLEDRLHDLYFNRYPWSSHDKVYDTERNRVYSGPPEVVKKWLTEQTTSTYGYRVNVGDRWGDMSVAEYLGAPGKLVFGG